MSSDYLEQLVHSLAAQRHLQSDGILLAVEHPLMPWSVSGTAEELTVSQTTTMISCKFPSGFRQNQAHVHVKREKPSRQMYICTACTSANRPNDVWCYECGALNCLACRQSNGTEWLPRTINRCTSHILLQQALSLIDRTELYNSCAQYPFETFENYSFNRERPPDHESVCEDRGSEEMGSDGAAWWDGMLLNLFFAEEHDLEDGPLDDEDGRRWLRSSVLLWNDDSEVIGCGW